MDANWIILLSMLAWVGVSTQSVIDATDVRLTEGGLLFGGTVEVLTAHGWERMCYTAEFTPQMGDAICRKLGFAEGAMSTRSAASLGIEVTPIPSLACHITTIEGVDTMQCQYATVCNDHAVVTCNYPGYLGCFSHSRRVPLLDGAAVAEQNMTIQGCLSHCRQTDLPYAGVAHGQECQCGAAELGSLRSSRLENEDCYLPCVGDRLQRCGGGTAIGVYDSRLGSCHRTYTETGGAITSPAFPAVYPDGTHQCAWEVRVPRAPNITVQLLAFDLYSGDRLTIANHPMLGEFVTFTGGRASSSAHFQSSGGPSLAIRDLLTFTFTGDRISVTFNSTASSLGSQGFVLTFIATVGPPSVDLPTVGLKTVPQPQPTTVVPATTNQIVANTRPRNTTSPATNATLTQTTTSSMTSSMTSQINERTAKTTQSEVTTEGATVDVRGFLLTTQGHQAGTTQGSFPTTPQLISTATKPTSPVAVVVAIVVVTVLMMMLVATSLVLFQFRIRTGHHSRGSREKSDIGPVISNAAYMSSDDSGIYDPCYDSTDLAADYCTRTDGTDSEPIYLSIRNDPRATSTKRPHKTDHYRPREGEIDREPSTRTTKSDHDYQSVNELTRRNTENSYISIYPDYSSGPVHASGGGVSPVIGPSPGPCAVAEDGYMVPTPRNSAQFQQTNF